MGGNLHATYSFRKAERETVFLCFQKISFTRWLMVVALVAHLLLTGSTSFHLPAVLIIVWKLKDYESPLCELQNNTIDFLDAVVEIVHQDYLITVER